MSKQDTQESHIPLGPASCEDKAVYDSIAAQYFRDTSKLEGDDELLARAVTTHLTLDVLGECASPAEIFEKGFRAGLEAARRPIVLTRGGKSENDLLQPSSGSHLFAVLEEPPSVSHVESPMRSHQGYEITDRMAYAFHSSLSDGAIGAAEVETLKRGLLKAAGLLPEPGIAFEITPEMVMAFQWATNDNSSSEEEIDAITFGLEMAFAHLMPESAPKAKPGRR